MRSQTSRKILDGKLQRSLRNAPTDVETALWRHLRGRQLDDCKFRRQHPFLDFVLDFVCLDRKLAVELDGGQHSGASGYDARRIARLEAAGFVVLRFWNNEVLENIDGVLEVILRALQDRMKPSPPNPPLEGEG